MLFDFEPVLASAEGPSPMSLLDSRGVASTKPITTLNATRGEQKCPNTQIEHKASFWGTET